MINNKILIIIVTLILLGVAGFFGYKYITGMYTTETITETVIEPNNNSENLNSETESNEVIIDNENDESQITTSDAEIDQELENLDQSLDLQLDEEIQ